MGRKAIDMDGRRFGRLEVIDRAGLVSRSATWNCKCDCGVELVVFGLNLRSGDTQSCGCLHSEMTSARSLKHGHIGGSTRKKRRTTKTYRCWSNMINRCRNPNAERWLDYGGRGIQVCEQWQDFRQFLEDMGEAPVGLTIERKNNDGNYEPNNCKWATYREQRANQRPNGSSLRPRHSNVPPKTAGARRGQARS